MGEKNPNEIKSLFTQNNNSMDVFFRNRLVFKIKRHPWCGLFFQNFGRCTTKPLKTSVGELGVIAAFSGTSASGSSCGTWCGVILYWNMFSLQIQQAFNQPGKLGAYRHGGCSCMSLSEEIPSDTKQGTMNSRKRPGKLHSSLVRASSYSRDLKGKGIKPSNKLTWRQPLRMSTKSQQHKTSHPGCMSAGFNSVCGTLDTVLSFGVTEARFPFLATTVSFWLCSN